MSDLELKAVAAQVKKLRARVEALERLLERILRQKPSPRGSWRGCLGAEA
jgi:ubiquinone biosynthesis protein UbiJ